MKWEVPMARRIMIIDDDRYIGEAVKDRLDALGYDAIAFTDGCSALATIALESTRSPLDLVLLDLMMPGMNGMEVLRELRHRHREIPVIMMSATEEREEFMEALRVGARDYVNKPLDFNILAHKCRLIFEHLDKARNST
jgi:DNA-binding response OmpR family regulator